MAGLEPTSDHEYLMAIWRDVQELKAALPELDERVTALEQFRAICQALAACVSVVVAAAGVVLKGRSG